MSKAVLLLSGVLITLYLVAALFFARFWRDASDRLFLFFSGAFALLALDRLLLLFFPQIEAIYLLRLLAFLLIILAIAEKNRVRA